MKNVFVALSLALALVPAAAVAQTQPSAVRSITPAQRQQMYQQFEAFHQREMQLHQQFRAQVLGTLSGDHRTQVANLIGQLAVSSNPDPRQAAAQIDSMLSQGEKQQILNADNTFRAQAKALHNQMKQQMRNEMPGGPMGEHPWMPQMQRQPQMQPDAGTIVLRTLSMPMGGEHHMMGGGPPPGR